MKFYIYQDKSKEWRWTLVARNGRKVADSGEGYKRQATAEKAVLKFHSAVETAKIVEGKPPRGVKKGVVKKKGVKK